MYKIEKQSYGYKLVFGGFIKNDEMAKWCDESKAALKGRVGGFGVVVDMRTLKPLAQEVQATMVQGQKQYKTAGLTRSAVILSDAVTTMQFKRLAKESGISAWERYIDASSTPAWEQASVRWVRDGVDPD